ncbi:MAG: DUF1847 domain-containing protein [Dehalococcoidia bacterium]
MTETLHPMCSKCGRAACSPVIGVDEIPTLEEAPSFCPMTCVPDLIDAAVSEYDKPEVRDLARQASIQEFECYERTAEGLRTRIPRIEELMQFASKCNYRRLGIAFCLGLRREAQMLTDILESREFEVVSICCKAGAIAKQRIGIRPDQHIGGSDAWESMCNPIVQAEVLNAAKVDLAIMLGLCIGHDTLFILYCRVPMTVLAVKDRVTGHNPLAALYLSQSPYYRRLSARRSS